MKIDKEKFVRTNKDAYPETAKLEEDLIEALEQAESCYNGELLLSLANEAIIYMGEFEHGGYDLEMEVKDHQVRTILTDFFLYVANVSEEEHTGTDFIKRFRS